MMQAHCWRDTKGYRHTLSLCHYCFTTAAVVTRTRLTVTLHVTFPVLLCVMLLVRCNNPAQEINDEVRVITVRV